MSRLVIPSNEIERVGPLIVQAYIDERIPSAAAHESLRAMKAEGVAQGGCHDMEDGYLPNALRPITQYDSQTVANLALLNIIKNWDLIAESSSNPAVAAAFAEANIMKKTWHMAGAAVTCRIAPGDNLFAHAAVEQCSFPGAVLVVGATEDGQTQAYGNFGDLLIAQLRHRKVAGMVVDGSTRDTENLIKCDFPTWARLPSIQGTGKERMGSVNHTIGIGNTTITPGDLVVADTDGICVVPAHLALEVLQRSRARIAGEDKTREEYLVEGKLSLDGKRSLRAVIARLEAATL